MNKQDLKKKLQDNQLKPIKKLGQNFLIQEEIIQTIVKSIKKYSPPFVEIGPGLGALTQYFNKEDIWLIEKDKKIAQYWKKKSWRVLCLDALHLSPDQLPEKMILFGNLPYEIAGSLILKLSEENFPSKAMVFLLQKEVAQRIKSGIRNKNYGWLSVVSQIFWNISTITHVSKTCFYPIPKVNGTVLEFQKKQDFSFSPPLFLKFVKQCFQFKRKMLFKKLPVREPKKLLEKISLNPECRAEDIPPKGFVRLYLEINS
ncbi:MAG: ribosomal RNA small subunit methyltransferase A [Bdellovibrionales bacterium]|nr:ribosomal RNA small subunit methyltransferase A [Bdellovibrionales bacterium]